MCWFVKVQVKVQQRHVSRAENWKPQKLCIQSDEAGASEQRREISQTFRGWATWEIGKVGSATHWYQFTFETLFSQRVLNITSAFHSTSHSCSEIAYSEVYGCNVIWCRNVHELWIRLQTLQKKGCYRCWVFQGWSSLRAKILVPSLNLLNNFNASELLLIISF